MAQYWHFLKLYNQVLRQQGIASPLQQSIASPQRPQEAVMSHPPVVWQSCHGQQDSSLKGPVCYQMSWWEMPSHLLHIESNIKRMHNKYGISLFCIQFHSFWLTRVGFFCCLFVFCYLLGCKHIYLPWGLLTKLLSTQINRSGEFSFMVTWDGEKLKKEEEKGEEWELGE